jgi:dolichyl-phosphate beta-glucosyltransferase
MTATPSENSISLIIPAYQEEKRIGATISAISQYLERHHPDTELIVVCDGCTDGTAREAKTAFSAPSCRLKMIELAANQGKGNAVRVGVDAASGNFLFFTDADLSFAPEVMEEFLQRLQDGADIAIAQRKKNSQYPGVGRRLLALFSRFLVGNFILPGIRDTQAGYKAFTAGAAKYLFSRLRTSRFLFDLEILVMARRRNYRIDKVYVDWEDRPGSTVNLVRDTLRSAFDLAKILLRSWTGQYD